MTNPNDDHMNQTKREYYSGCFMAAMFQGGLVDPVDNTHKPKIMAMIAVHHADVLIAELNKPTAGDGALRCPVCGGVACDCAKRQTETWRAQQNPAQYPGNPLSNADKVMVPLNEILQYLDLLMAENRKHWGLSDRSEFICQTIIIIKEKLMGMADD